TIGLANERNVVFCGEAHGYIDSRIGRLRAINRPSADFTIAIKTLPLGHKTPVKMGRDLADQVELVGGVAIPICRNDAKRTNLLDHLRQNASAVKIRKKQVDWLLAMQAAYFVLKLF